MTEGYSNSRTSRGVIGLNLSTISTSQVLISNNNSYCLPRFNTSNAVFQHQPLVRSTSEFKPELRTGAQIPVGYMSPKFLVLYLGALPHAIYGVPTVSKVGFCSLLRSPLSPGEPIFATAFQVFIPYSYEIVEPLTIAKY